MHTYIREACCAIFSFQSMRDKTKSAPGEENDVFTESGFFIYMVPQSIVGLFAAHGSVISQIVVVLTANLLTGSTLRKVVHLSG